MLHIYIYIYIYVYIYDISSLRVNDLTLILLTWRKWTPNNANKWQMGFNSAFKGLMVLSQHSLQWVKKTLIPPVKIGNLASKSGLSWYEDGVFITQQTEVVVQGHIICRFITLFIQTLHTSGGTRWRIWLRHCATSRKIAGSIPDCVTGFF